MEPELFRRGESRNHSALTAKEEQMRLNAVYESVTATIIKDLEAGVIPWTKCWNAGDTIGMMPTNAATGRSYNGINIPILWDSAERNGFTTQGWMSYRQATTLGANVRKGEKGTVIVFTKRLPVKNEQGEDQGKTIGMLKSWHVFNVAQIDGLPEGKRPEPIPVSPFIEATGAEFRPGNQPMYVPSLDFIAMPPPSTFENEQHYQATALHELVHFSGHPKRLDRDLKGRFGSSSYAAEELIAELGAAFLCAHLGIKGELRHASYIDHWLAMLKEDSRAIFTASSKASQAADYLRSFSEQIEQAA